MIIHLHFYCRQTEYWMNVCWKEICHFCFYVHIFSGVLHHISQSCQIFTFLYYATLPILSDWLSVLCVQLHTLQTGQEAWYPSHFWRQNVLCFCTLRFIWGGAGKSLARPGRKQATVTKLRIYSTYSPRGSLHFLAHCSNFCKPLQKNSGGCPSNQVSTAAMTSASDEKWQPFNCFFSPGNRW